MMLILTRKLAVYVITWATTAGALWTTTLDHKIGNDAMEYQAIVKPLFSEIRKVLHRVWCIFFKKLDL